MKENDLVTDLITESLIDNKPVFEDDYRIVKSVIDDINMGTNYSKRVAEVIWKKSNNKEPVIDIRVFNIEKNEYYKGISFSREEAFELKKVLDNYFKED